MEKVGRCRTNTDVRDQDGLRPRKGEGINDALLMSSVRCCFARCCNNTTNPQKAIINVSGNGRASVRLCLASFSLYHVAHTTGVKILMCSFLLDLMSAFPLFRFS